jgi:hypothetical protein
MKNSWFGTTAVPALQAFLPTYRLTPGNFARADFGTIPFGILRPFHGMRRQHTIQAAQKPALYLITICRFPPAGNRRPKTIMLRCNIATS